MQMTRCFDANHIGKKGKRRKNLTKTKEFVKSILQLSGINYEKLLILNE